VLAATDAQRTVALRLRAQAALYRGENAMGYELGQQAAASAARIGDDVEYLCARTVAARGAARGGATAEAIAMLRADADLAQRAGDDDYCSHCGVLATLLQLAMRVQESQVEIDTAVVLARRLGRWADLANLLSNRGTNHAFVGRFDDALGVYLEALKLAESHELRGVGLQFMAMNIANALLELNRYSEAWDWLQRAETDVRRDAPAFLPLVAAMRARWYLELGQGHRAASALDSAPEDATTPAFVTSYRHVLRAGIEADARRDPAAHVQRALALASNCGRQFVLWEVRLNAAALGCSADAGDLRELQRSAREHGFSAHALAAAALAADPDADAPRAGLVAGATGRWVYRGRLLLAQLDSAPASALVDRLRAFAAEWLSRTQSTHVPAEFRESFLHRNPVNRRLWELTRRTPASPG
jgi:tetratricopeptide (TPR) repeat protein